MDATPRFEDLLVHAPFVRRVARAAVSGDHDVDDVVQETWLEALEHPPRNARSLRGWLATVARNLARSRGRSAGRRGRHERAAARAEAVPSTARIAEREEIRRHLLEAVLSLDEPYRSAVLLRYYEDLPPREVAARLGVPVETVRTRVRRALDRLRSDLDARHRGDRRGWLGALAPLAGLATPVGAASTLLPLAAAAAAVLVVVGAAVLRPWPSDGLDATEAGEEVHRAAATDREEEGPRLRPAPAAPAPRGRGRLTVHLEGGERPALVELLAVDAPRALGPIPLFQSLVSEPDARLLTAKEAGAGVDRIDVDGLPEGVLLVRVRQPDGRVVQTPTHLVEGAHGAAHLDLSRFPHVLEGRVTFEGDASLEARVWIQGEDIPRGMGTALLPHGPPARSLGEDGAFRFPHLQEGRYRVFVVVASRWVRCIGDVRVPQEEPLEIHVAATSAPAGRVVDALTQVGIAGASVYGYRLGGEADFEVARIESDDEGRFAIPAGADQGFFVTAAGYLMARFLPREPAGAWTVPLERARTLRGRVVEDASGKPLRGVKVRIAEAEHPKDRYVPRLREVYETLADGRFVVADIGPGAFAIFAHGGGWTSSGLAEVPKDGHNPFIVEVPEEGVPPEVELRVVPATALEGVVLDVDGQPVAGAVVRFARAGLGTFSGAGALPHPLAATGADGRFRLEDAFIARGGSARVVATHPEHGIAESTSWTTLPAEGDGVTLRFPPPRTVEVRVEDEQGRPIEGARITVWRDLGSGTRTTVPTSASLHGQRTDGDGRIRLTGLPLGDLRLEVVAEGRVRAEGEAVTGDTVTVRLKRPAPAAPPSPDAVRVARPGEVFLVRVVGPDGKDIPRFWLRQYERTPGRAPFAIGAGPRSDPVAAVFRQADDAVEVWVEVFDARDERGRPLPFGAVLLGPDALAKDLREVEARLPLERDVQGRLVDEEGRPMRGVVVGAYPRFADLPPPDQNPHDETRTDAEGAFRLRRLGAFDYDLVAVVPTSHVMPDPAIIRGGERDVLLVARTCRAVEVEVLGPDGRGLANASVLARPTLDASGKPPRFLRPVVASTSASGIARMEGLHPDRTYDLVLRPPGAVPAARGRTLEAWQPRHVTLRLETAHVVEGVVVDGAGRPLPYANVSRQTSPALWTKARADAEGRFGFEEVPAGDVVLRAAPQHDVQPSRGEPITVRAGARDVRLVVETGIPLRLQLPEPLPPMQFCTAEVRSPDEAPLVHTYRLHFDERGRADLYGLDPALAYDVLVVRNNERPALLRGVRPGDAAHEVSWRPGIRMGVTVEGIPEGATAYAVLVTVDGPGWERRGVLTAKGSGVLLVTAIPEFPCRVRARYRERPSDDPTMTRRGGPVLEAVQEGVASPEVRLRLQPLRDR